MQFIRVASIAVVTFFVLGATGYAQEAAAAVATPLISFSSAFGAALTIVGAGYGISKIGAAAVESMARQPEVADKIQGGMLLSAAFIEGATFFALIVCIIEIFG